MKARRIRVKSYGYDWPNHLEVGDVIARPNGPFRVVRKVSKIAFCLEDRNVHNQHLDCCDVKGIA